METRVKRHQDTSRQIKIGNRSGKDPTLAAGERMGHPQRQLRCGVG